MPIAGGTPPYPGGGPKPGGGGGIPPKPGGGIPGMPMPIGGGPPKPGGGGGGPAASAPANCPWYGPWYGMPGGGIGVVVTAGPEGAEGPNAASALSVAGGGRAVTGSALFFRACAASRRSAAVPCRSPFPSFLNAYCTVMALFIRNWPFIASIAPSADSKSV